MLFLVVYDYEYTFLPQGKSEPEMKRKILLLCYVPDQGSIRKKMLYSSSSDTLKKEFKEYNGTRRYSTFYIFQFVKSSFFQALQVNDEIDLDSAYIEEQLRAVD